MLINLNPNSIGADGDELSLRDLFALGAAQAMLANPNLGKLFTISGFIPDDDEWTQRIGNAAYKVADSMVKSRSRAGRPIAQ